MLGAKDAKSPITRWGFSCFRGAPGSIEPGNAFLSASGGDGGELNSKHGPTVADALRDLSIALAHLANALDKASPK